jgi:uncharacterized protein YfbU (UPF0304 family)
MSNDIPDSLFKRMVLANQYRMLALLDADDEGYWRRAAEMAIQAWPVENLPDVEIIRSYQGDALTREDQHFVLDALNVFELLQDGERAGFTPKSEHATTAFLGFDGNNESKLMSYARHAVENEHRFESVKRASESFNSHMPTVELYQRMISTWERFGRPLHISKALFDALLDAQVHPSFADRAPATPA